MYIGPCREGEASIASIEKAHFMLPAPTVHGLIIHTYMLESTEHVHVCLNSASYAR